MAFKKGEARPETAGRKKGTPNQRTLLLQAIEQLKEKEGIDFWPTVLKLAFKLANEGTDTGLMKELVKKLLPDQVIQGAPSDFEGFEFGEG